MRRGTVRNTVINGHGDSLAGVAACRSIDPNIRSTKMESGRGRVV
jgi:hypothetical protein